MWKVPFPKFYFNKLTSDTAGSLEMDEALQRKSDDPQMFWKASVTKWFVCVSKCETLISFHKSSWVSYRFTQVKFVHARLQFYQMAFKFHCDIVHVLRSIQIMMHMFLVMKYISLWENFIFPWHYLMPLLLSLCTSRSDKHDNCITAHRET